MTGLLLNNAGTLGFQRSLLEAKEGCKHSIQRPLTEMAGIRRTCPFCLIMRRSFQKHITLGTVFVTTCSNEIHKESQHEVDQE